MTDPRSDLGRLLGVPIVRAEPADARVAGGGRAASAGQAQPFGVGTRAWRIVTADGQVLLAKQAEPAELAWSAALAEETAAVPRVLAARAGWLVAEWIDGVTLDDALQAEHDSSRLAAALLAGVRELEAACERVERRFGSDPAASAFNGPAPGPTALGVVPPATPEPQGSIGSPVERIGEALTQAEAGLVWAARHFGAALPADFGARLDDLVGTLTRTATTSGPLDINARNALVEGERLRFIDFSVVGRDVPERRALLYGTALGASRPGGRFVSLAPAMADALPPAAAARLDACDLLLWGAVALRLAAAVVAPESRPGQFVRAVWGEPRRRLSQLRGQLARPLSPLTAALRTPFGA